MSIYNKTPIPNVPPIYASQPTWTMEAQLVGCL